MPPLWALRRIRQPKGQQEQQGQQKTTSALLRRRTSSALSPRLSCPRGRSLTTMEMTVARLRTTTMVFKQENRRQQQQHQSPMTTIGQKEAQPQRKITKMPTTLLTVTLKL